LRTRDIAADRGVADIVDRFSPLALGAAAILVATGVINALMHFDAVREVSQSPYGRTLIVKVALVAMVIAAGAFNWRRQRPRLGSVGSAALVRSSIAIELAFALAVLAVTGYLTGLPRPG
jgi:putative copper export protein